MFDPHNNYRHVEVRDNRMSYQEPQSKTTLSTTAKNDNPMSCQEPKPRTMSLTTAKNDTHISCDQEPKPMTTSKTAKNDNGMSSQEPKPRTTSTTVKNDNDVSFQEPKPRTTSWTTVRTMMLPHLMLLIAILGVRLISVVVTELPHAQDHDPKPTQWPDQFHSRIVMNNSGTVELVDFWYDWTNGCSLNIIQRQRGSVLYDLEWNNGTSFHYTVGSHGTCSSSHMEVKATGGILKPDWLDRLSYAGQREVDGSLCNVWEIAELVTYYEDAVTKRPVHWVFHTGREAHVMTFEVGAALEDAKWQVPSYCFEQTDATEELAPMDVGAITHRGLVHSGTRKVEDVQN